MRHALSVCAAAGSIVLVVACVGGPGSADQGGENGDQYGGIATTGGQGAQVGNRGDEGAPPGSSSTTTSTSGAPTTPPPEDLRASDYDQSCERDSDCTAIYEGPACQQTQCQCNNAAIASKDNGDYSRDKTTRLVACISASSSSGGSSCTPCENQERDAHCNAAKRCQIGANPNPPDGG
ncbi:MAG: hypothetical protein KIT84_06275 [Labilithrix sp.]|nr:hypothetical protein [Labilithrix sp.]MCW5810598.1 hypothetical protein [Labilithrix sp.]